MREEDERLIRAAGIAKDKCLGDLKFPDAGKCSCCSGFEICEAIEARSEAPAEEPVSECTYKQAIQDAFKHASNRWSEWGQRAESVEEILDNALDNGRCGSDPTEEVIRDLDVVRAAIKVDDLIRDNAPQSEVDNAIGLMCNRVHHRSWTLKEKQPSPAEAVVREMRDSIQQRQAEFIEKPADTDYRAGVCTGIHYCEQDFKRSLAKHGVEVAGKEMRVSDGTPGVRDPNHPCKDFNPGIPDEWRHCEGDGHYLCEECAEKKLVR